MGSHNRRSLPALGVGLLPRPIPAIRRSLIYPVTVCPPRIPIVLIRPFLTASLLCAPLCAQQPAAQQPAAQQVTGKILNQTGVPILNAQISTPDQGNALPGVQTDAAGLFRLTLPPGDYTLHIAAPGYTALDFPFTAATPQPLTLTLLNVITTSADVTVTVTTHEIAEAQVHAEEQQRLIGAIPNFYVTYDHKAAPLSPGQKWQLGWRTTLDPVNVAINAGVAGIQQATNAFPGYHQGAAGYFKRFGANNADTAVGTLLGGVALPIVFHQDPRYFYLGQGTLLHRTLYALSTAFRAKGDNGQWQPAYASILGDLSEGAISNLYYPATDRNGPTLTFENGLISIGSDAVGNVIQEFFLRHLTPKLPPLQP